MFQALVQTERDDRLERIELQLAPFCRKGNRHIVADDSNAIWLTTSGITGLTLPGMIEEPA
jgi:hypothetical protein